MVRPGYPVRPWVELNIDDEVYKSLQYKLWWDLQKPVRLELVHVLNRDLPSQFKSQIAQALTSSSRLEAPQHGFI